MVLVCSVVQGPLVHLQGKTKRMLKRSLSYVGSALLITGLVLSVTAKDAHAYIDIGSSAYIFQVLVATVFGSLITIKLFWSRITKGASRFFSRLKGTRSNSR